MSRIFDPENKFWNAIGKVADVTRTRYNNRKKI